MRVRKLTIPRSRELVTPRSLKLVTLRSRATARPYGSEPYSRIDAKNKHFLFQGQLTLHARVRVAPPPNNSADLLHSNQLATLLNY